MSEYGEIVYNGQYFALEYQDACYGSQYFYLTAWKDKESQWSNSPIRRIKPDKPIWDPSMQTSLAKQYTIRNTPMLFHEDFYSQVNTECGTGMQRLTRNRGQWSYLSPSIAYSSLDAPPSTNWQTALRLQIGEEQVNLGTYLAEYRESCSLFRDTAQKLFEAFQHLRQLKRRPWTKFVTDKRGRTRKRRTPKSRWTIDDIAATELLASFALNPMLSDLEKSMAILDEARGSRPIVKRFVVTRAEIADGASAYVYQLPECRYHWENKDRAIAYVRYFPDLKPFTAGNILSVLWEGVPFSFVVDWMFNVGDTLLALDALSGVQSLSGTLTHKDDITYMRDTHTNKTIDQPWRWHYESHQRSVLSLNNIPLPDVIRYTPSNSWKAVRHGISLLWLLRNR